MSFVPLVAVAFIRCMESVYWGLGHGKNSVESCGILGQLSKLMYKFAEKHPLTPRETPGCVFTLKDLFMRRSIIVLLLSFSFLTLGLNAEAGDKWTIDGVHSSAIFKVRHAGVSNLYGRFNKIEGNLFIDEKTPSKSTVSIEVWTGSVDTNDAKRDKHLKGPDFFNVRQFPKMTFKSKSVKLTSKGVYEITGDFQLHGVSKEITVTAKHVGTAKRRGATRCGYEIYFSIKRSDYGIKYGLPTMIGDKVAIIVAIEAVKN